MKKTVLYINSENLGRGDDELGRNLLVVYLETFLHFGRDISHVLLINSGVKLACEGSEALYVLMELAGMDVKIMACGTCLKHFGLTDRIRAGSVSNMFAIQEALLGAEKVLSP